jgi:glycosyltransferase involved in cell wall biosynthesis
MQNGSSSNLRRKAFSAIYQVLKRLFPAGSMGRRLFYRLRARYGRSIISLDRRPPLHTDRELQQFTTWIQERNAPMVVVVLASTELLESEGQRSTNLALEFSQRGIPSVFGYWRWKSDYWAPQNRLDQGILQIPVDVLASWPEMVFRAFECREKLLLIEFPHPSFFKIVAEAHASGWMVIYDVVDDWEEFQRVGQAIWYEPQFERHLLNTADAITAVNPLLGDRLRALGVEEIEIIPNGLASDVHVVAQERLLERGDITIGYFGYLAGSWFDWKLLARAATARPLWKFYLIGYGGQPEGVRLPENIILLGKKPRSELASYAANWDVAIVPFKAEKLAEGADPIKTYEYLAMGLPVVVTGVYPPSGGEDLVQRVEALEEFLEAIKVAAQERNQRIDQRIAFAQTCSWSHRLDAILNMLEKGSQRLEEKRVMFGGDS